MDTKKVRILLVEDDLAALRSMEKMLKSYGFQIWVAQDGREALQKLQKNEVDLLITDIRMPELDGMDLLRAMRASHIEVPVIMMTAFGEVNQAVWAMKWGVVDFLTKPFSSKMLFQAIEAALLEKRVHKQQKGRGEETEGKGLKAEEGEELLGKSAVMRNVRSLIDRVAPLRETVLIRGESGTGKELVAKRLHQKSGLGGKFLAVNCAAFPENLLESELFGFEKGAFSGAERAQKGLFEAAEGGTLFLDEIGELPFSMQAKLLRVLQGGEVRRLGSIHVKKIQVRVVAATNQDLEQMVEEGRFRKDLYFRIRVFSIKLSPLRERKEDVLLLANVFLERAKKKFPNRSHIRGFHPEAISVLLRQRWPGNVRELQHFIERAVVFTEKDLIFKEVLEEKKGQTYPGSVQVPLGVSLKEIEEQLIEQVLELTGGDKQLTAKLLGIHVRTIYRKLAGKDEEKEEKREKNQEVNL